MTTKLNIINTTIAKNPIKVKDHLIAINLTEFQRSINLNSHS